jgi:hypothetical protein
VFGVGEDDDVGSDDYDGHLGATTMVAPWSDGGGGDIERRWWRRTRSTMTAAPWIDKRGGVRGFASQTEEGDRQRRSRTAAARSILRRRRGIGSWGGWQSTAAVPDGGGGDLEDDCTLDR